MIIAVDLYNAKPAYLQIVDVVRQAIALGSLKSGDRHLGLVQARQGSGVFVTECGAEQEQLARRQSVIEKIGELLTESRLSHLSTKQLLQLVETEARKMDSTKSGAAK